jgi:hypothetical protein
VRDEVMVDSSVSCIIFSSGNYIKDNNMKDEMDLEVISERF